MDKILIVSNPLNHEGGVVNYYNLFFKYFDSEKFKIYHFSIGSRAYLFYYPVLKRILYPFYFIYDIFRYIFILIFNRKFKIVQVNPSLIPVPLVRDGILVFIAKLLRKNVIVFYRGWKLNTLSKISKNKFFKNRFNKLYQTGTQQIVLASAFKDDLSKLGVSSKEVLITTTAIDAEQIILKETINKDVINVLFLGRVQDIKGVGEIVQSIIILNNRGLLNNFYFTFVGHEDKVGYIQMLKQELIKNNISEDRYQFLGRTTGKEKYRIYSINDIFLLPSYTEGCPNSVLEAMSSGLYCITTNVGALNDLIIPEENGMFVREKNSEDIAESLVYVYNNRYVLENRIERGEKYSVMFDIHLNVKFFDNLYGKITSQ